jgi:hypothetical protein
MAILDAKNIGLTGAQGDASFADGAQQPLNDELLQTFFFPPEMIGGSCPQVKGDEEMITWNAAAEACASERIHFIWREHEGRIWYLALKSEELASHSTSWCPFASLLPGSPDAYPSPIVYTYFSDEAATLMAVGTDSLQIIRGTSSVVRAKAERIVREMSGAQMVDLIPDKILNLKPVAWNSLSLLEDRARRFLGVATVLSALIVTLVAIFVWFGASIIQLSYGSELKDLQDRTASSLTELQQNAMVLRTSEMREQMARFYELNEKMIAMQGWLKLYLLQGSDLKWWAVVPENLTSDRISELGAQTIEPGPDGLIIANRRESYITKSGQK